mmetsp:Transcript_33136/g.83286  ORF Transcript_33136/g.83286 Transcript_33136/m.83286 type:complete len:311 (+) Transcript_33136:260-1192(+)
MRSRESSAKPSGLPGLSRTRPKRSSPKRLHSSLSRSRCPMLAPPLLTSRSTRALTARCRAATTLSSVSAAQPRSTGIQAPPDTSRTAAISEGRLLSRTRPGGRVDAAVSDSPVALSEVVLSEVGSAAREVPSSSGSGSSSSPVLSTPTRSWRRTDTRRRPRLANSPISAAPSRQPAGRTSSPARTSQPTGRTSWPALSGHSTRMASSRSCSCSTTSLNSTMSTALLPGGSGAPVAMRRAQPAASGGACPVAPALCSCPSTRRITAVSSVDVGVGEAVLVADEFSLPAVCWSPLGRALAAARRSNESVCTA